LAGDVAGIVVEADPGSAFPPGTAVFAMTDGFKWDVDAHGCFAEYVSFPEAWAAAAPASIPLADAAALPLVALTALQTLRAAPNLKENDTEAKPPRILVHAGAGGVGHVGVQLAKNLFGGTVTATAGPANQAFLKGELGVDEPVDYKATPPSTALVASHAGVFDAILDVVGGAEGEDTAAALLAPGGSYCHVFASNTSEEKTAEIKAKLEGEGKHYVGPTLVSPDGPALKTIAALVDAGKLKPVIHRRVGLDGLAAAMEEVEAGHVRGKIVVDVAPA
jgi:NADPH:quinone reductase-like Zn-dependent oxidoreductase